MTVIAHWTYCENLETGSRFVLKPGEYRAKNLRHEPGVFEMTDLVPAEQLRGAVDLLRWALPYVPEPTHDMGSCEYVENYAQALIAIRRGQ